MGNLRKYRLFYWSLLDLDVVANENNVRRKSQFKKKIRMTSYSSLYQRNHGIVLSYISKYL
jgi:hypothetical protein